MSDYDYDPGRPRPEVVNETVVVVDSGRVAGKAWGLVLAVGIVAVVFGILVLANIWGSVHLVPSSPASSCCSPASCSSSSAGAARPVASSPA